MVWFIPSLLALILFSAPAYSLDGVYKCKESHNRIVYSQAPCSGNSEKIKLYDNTADYSFERNKIAQEIAQKKYIAKKEAGRKEKARKQSREEQKTIPRNSGAINVRTGEFLAPSGNGYVGTRDGRYYAPAGPNGVIDTRTGQFIPMN